LGTLLRQFFIALWLTQGVGMTNDMQVIDLGKIAAQAPHQSVYGLNACTCHGLFIGSVKCKQGVSGQGDALGDGCRCDGRCNALLADLFNPRDGVHLLTRSSQLLHSLRGRHGLQHRLVGTLLHTHVMRLTRCQ